MTERALRAAVAAFVRSYLRSPFNLVMLVVIPVLFVRSFGASLARFGNLVNVVIPVRSGDALTALWAALFLTALTGMFTRAAAREADRRLVLCGLSPNRAAVARLIAVAQLAVLPVLVSFALLAAIAHPVQPWPVLGALYLAALLYAGLGVLIGGVTPTPLEGSFVLMIVFIADVFLGSPLFAGSGWAANLTPARAPSDIVIAALSGAGHAPGHWALLTAYTAAALALAVWSFRREAGR